MSAHAVLEDARASEADARNVALRRSNGMLGPTVRLDVRLESSAQLLRDLEMVEAELRAIRGKIEREEKEASALFVAQFELQIVRARLKEEKR